MCVFAVEFSGKAIQAAAQSFLMDLHQLLAFSVQFHTNAKLTFPVSGLEGSQLSFVRSVIKQNASRLRKQT